jgi:hypothetical protein
MTKHVTALPEWRVFDMTTALNNDSNSSEAQRARLLAHLKQFGSATTIELRRDLDVMMPAARVHELRHHFGHNITMARVYQPTDGGKMHRVARYFLHVGIAHVNQSND